MYILKKDGQEKFKSERYDMCLAEIHKLTSVSWHQALTFEGWTITKEQKNDIA